MDLCTGKRPPVPPELCATHHSALQKRRPTGDRRPAPEPGRWRSKPRTTAYGHRRLLHRGAPGILAEPGPQRSDRSLRHSSEGAPPLVLVSLAGGDAPDDATVAFLLSAALTMKKEEEEEEESGSCGKKNGRSWRGGGAKALKGWGRGGFVAA